MKEKMKTKEEINWTKTGMKKERKEMKKNRKE